MFIDGFKSHDAVFRQWNVNPDGKTVIFAVYVHEGSDSEWAVAYRAKALVLFHQGNDLFIVEETHFAFDGLKFWNPNKISITELKKRVMESDRGSIISKYQGKLLEIISDMENMGIDSYVVLTRLNGD